MASDPLSNVCRQKSNPEDVKLSFTLGNQWFNSLYKQLCGTGPVDLATRLHRNKNFVALNQKLYRTHPDAFGRDGYSLEELYHQSQRTPPILHSYEQELSNYDSEKAAGLTIIPASETHVTNNKLSEKSPIITAIPYIGSPGTDANSQSKFPPNSPLGKKRATSNYWPTNKQTTLFVQEISSFNPSNQFEMTHNSNTFSPKPSKNVVRKDDPISTSAKINFFNPKVDSPEVGQSINSSSPKFLMKKNVPSPNFPNPKNSPSDLFIHSPSPEVEIKEKELQLFTAKKMMSPGSAITFELHQDNEFVSQRTRSRVKEVTNPVSSSSQSPTPIRGRKPMVDFQSSSEARYNKDITGTRRKTINSTTSQPNTFPSLNFEKKSKSRAKVKHKSSQESHHERDKKRRREE